MREERKEPAAPSPAPAGPGAGGRPNPFGEGYRRFPTRVVDVGTVAVGGENPIVIQSMTIADTLDTEATVREIAGLVAAGCPLVRVTCPSVREADNLAAIKKGLKQRGIDVPLIADVHFTPNAALRAAELVEKVRINPGNYADRKKFKIREYTDAEYRAELERIHDRFKPLVLKLKENGAALRIGANHGSLSDRILNRYGDTPMGMVESALEFVRICRAHGFHGIILSMKSSVARVAVEAHRLLVDRMIAEGMDYPIHLGVTEAGAGLPARIKSAIGIGGLLAEGIGDTIRVSLTEPSVREIDACRRILAGVARSQDHFAPYLPADMRRDPGRTRSPSPSPGDARPWSLPRPAAFGVPAPRPRIDLGAFPIGGDGALPVRVHVAAGASLSDGTVLASELSTWAAGAVGAEGGPEAFWISPGPGGFDPGPVALIVDALGGRSAGRIPWILRAGPCSAEALAGAQALLPWVQGVCFAAPCAGGDLARRAARTALLHKRALFWEGDGALDACLRSLDAGLPAVGLVVAGPTLRARVQDAQARSAGLDRRILVVLEPFGSAVDGALAAGPVLLEGLGDALLVGPAAVDEEGVPALEGAYGILQGCRLRLTTAEFISCPSCGRTQFDLETTTERIRRRTGHLKGVKIAVMGCIVNGPGEMADADFGYVGSGLNKIDLYEGHRRVRQNLSPADADDALVDLIRCAGRWVDPHSLGELT